MLNATCKNKDGGRGQRSVRVSVLSDRSQSSPGTGSARFTLSCKWRSGEKPQTKVVTIGHRPRRASGETSYRDTSVTGTDIQGLAAGQMLDRKTFLGCCFCWCGGASLSRKARCGLVYPPGGSASVGVEAVNGGAEARKGRTYGREAARRR